MRQGLGYAALAVALAGGASAAQAVSFTGTFTQNFDTLATSGTTNALAASTGFSIFETGTSTTTVNQQYAADDGTNNAGDTYSYGTGTATDRALGTLQSGSNLPRIDAVFTNANAAAATSITVGYTGEQWRLGQAGRVDRLDFSYSLDNVTFVPLSALSFTAPVTTGTVGALNGNLAANRTALSALLPGVALASGASLYLRWTDFNATGSDDGLAIDDFTLTPTFAAAVPEPTTWGMMIGGMALAGGMMRRRRGAASVRFA